MRFFQLEVFCRVVDCQGFSAAAAELHVTQPAVSRHIRDLEREMGTRLLDRAGGRISLTPAGMILYRSAAALLHTKENAVASIRFLLNRPVVVGTSLTCLPAYLEAAARTFSDQNPEDRILTRVDHHNQIVQGVMDGTIDLAIVWAPVRAARVVIQPMNQASFCLAVAAGHPLAQFDCVTPENLQTASFILGCPGTLPRRYEEEWLRRISVQPVPVVETSCVSVAKQAVAAGHGLAFLPEREARDDIVAGRIRVVNCPTLLPLVRDLYVALLQIPTGPSASRSSHKFLQFFATQLGVGGRATDP